MKKALNILAVASTLLVLSCEHKDLCYIHDQHALKYHVMVNAEYRQEWEELCTDYIDWEVNWPENYIPYDELRPSKPKGLRVIQYTTGGSRQINNLPADGGTVGLSEGENDLLFYNNDTEYIVFTDSDHISGTRATTRTKTRATYNGNPYNKSDEEEETVNPPDMLYGNYISNYIPEKVEKPTPINVTLHPLVFTYKVRYEFEEGLEYVSIARGALSGMAMYVNLSTGETSDEAATVLYDCEVTDFGVRALVNSFGTPGYPNGSYTKGDPIYGLNLEVRLKNGKIKSFDFDITEQMKAQPHGGVIVVKGIKISKDDGMSGSGAFDVEVGDWGEYEDITLPLT